MRNGFSIASSSEFVHEIREDPEEARFYYHATARYEPGRGLRAWTQPAMLGRVKSARRFELDLADERRESQNETARDEPTPFDVLLAALGVCSLKTAIIGGSARGIEFDNVEMGVSAATRSGANGTISTGRVDELAYAIDVQSDSDALLIDKVTRQMLERSPNHRTMTDKTPVRFRVGSYEVAWQESAPVELAASAEHRTRRRVRWISGTQFESTPDDRPDLPLRVDEAKQFSGVDWAPNPQEYVVMAMAAEVAALAQRQQEARTGDTGCWTVHSRGILDLRGLMNVGEGSSVGFESITCDIEGPEENSADDTVAQARAAIEESIVVNLVTDAHLIDVSLSLNNEQRYEPRTAGMPG